MGTSAHKKQHTTTTTQQVRQTPQLLDKSVFASFLQQPDLLQNNTIFTFVD